MFEEPEFCAWLKEQGCEGVSRVEFRGLPGQGVWLRPEVPSLSLTEDSQVVSVPRNAWICERADVAEPEVVLAWRLLQERWRGASSAFAPYVDYLWRVELRLHPLFWEPSEAAWLRVSYVAHEQLLDLREAMERRLKALQARVQKAQGSEAPPVELLKDPTRLEAELRQALVLVEVRATTASPASPGEPSCCALVPLLDALRHDGTGDPMLQVGEMEEGSALCAVVLQDLQPGAELKHCYERISSAALLVHYGQLSRRETADETREANAYHSVPLAIRVTPNSEVAQVLQASQSGMTIKLDMLKKRLGLDLRDGVLSEKTTLFLPRDLMAKGRLLPICRFLSAKLPDDSSQISEQEACEILFTKYFQGVLEDGVPPPPCPQSSQELLVEVTSRSMAWDWCDRALQRYQKVGSSLMNEIRGKKAPTLGAAAAPKGIVEGSLVHAHYKAKGKDGARTRSRGVKQARVLAVDGEEVTVQFLQNGVRQRVPREWVIADKEADEEAAEKDVDEVAAIHAARGELALALVLTESSVLELIAKVIQIMAKRAWAVYNDLETNKTAAAKRGLSELSSAWEEEHEMMRKWEEMYAGPQPIED